MFMLTQAVGFFQVAVPFSSVWSVIQNGIHFWASFVFVKLFLFYMHIGLIIISQFAHERCLHRMYCAPWYAQEVPLPDITTVLLTIQ